jgi:HSP20 family molecular chaperone IbpA
VDIYETEGGFVLLADIPGAREEDVNVHVDEDVLTLEARAAKCDPEHGTATQREFEARLYRRTFALSRDIDRDGIKGKVEQGVLRIELPKAPEAKVRKIAIKTG